MSQHDTSSKGTTIKIAAKDASQRNSGSQADPGPGDPSAAPSVAPQLVDIPDPPTSSQLVVKSTASKKSSNLQTMNEGRSGTAPSTKGLGPKSVIQASMSNVSQNSKLAQSSPGSSVGAPREPTSSKQLTGAPESNVGSTSGPKSTASIAASKSSAAGSKSGATGSPMSGTGAPMSQSGAAKSASGAPMSQSGAAKSASGAATSPVTASTAMQADSGVVHDEDEEGEGELEHPGEASPSGAATSPSAAGKSTSATKIASGKSISNMGGPSTMLSSDGKSGPSSSKDKKNKVTKFRYHKRIVVRTKGNANPSSIMDKVNKKAGNQRITPSTIEDMDPQEIMKRAGIKDTNKTHWRVRLRQTKRLTKNGKTTTQTKVAYRDSEGNKRVKTSLNPFCKNCGKKLEECKCDANSQS